MCPVEAVSKCPEMISTKCLTYLPFDVSAEGFSRGERNFKDEVARSHRRNEGVIAIRKMRIGLRQWVLSRGGGTSKEQ